MNHHLRPDRPGTRLTTAVALGALGLGVALALGVRTTQLTLVLRSPSAVPGIDALVELGVVAIGTVLAGWLGLSAVLAAGCLLARTAGHVWHDGERLVARTGPAVVRRTLAVTVAAGLGVGSAIGAQAAPPAIATTAGTTTVVMADPGDLGWPVTDPTPAPDGPTSTPVAAPTATQPALTQPTAAGSTAGPSAGTLPTDSPTQRPTDQVPAEATPVTAPSATAGTPGTGATSQVVVGPGDTLWEIARRSLPDGASHAQVAAAWPAWYEANRQTIGADPDLILPGQVLYAPEHLA